MVNVLDNTTDPEYTVRTGTVADLPFCVALQKEFCDQMGFVTRGAIEQRLGEGHYHILTLRGQDAAFVYTLGGILTSVRIVQHAVTRELWLNGYGSVLAAVAGLVSTRKKRPGIRLTVRDDIQTHGFWSKLGAIPVQVRPGGRTRKKMLIDYEIPAATAARLAADLFTSPGELDPRIDLLGDRSLPLFSLPQHRRH